MLFEDDTPDEEDGSRPYPRNPPINLIRDPECLHPGNLYAFEGVDGSGKSTLVRAAATATRQSGRDVDVLKLNGSEIVRHALPLAKWLNVDPVSFNLLNWISLFHQTSVHLGSPEDRLLFFDRYSFTVKARGILEGLRTDYMELLAAHLPRPTKVFFIDCPPRLCQERILASSRRITYFEAGYRDVEGPGALMVERGEEERRSTAGREDRLLEHLRRMREVYLELLRDSDGVIRIDNSGPIEVALGQILEHVNAR